MQLQPLPNYSQILAFQIVHKGSDLGGRWSAPWLGGHPPYVLLVSQSALTIVTIRDVNNRNV